ncbi:HNH endonuclease signature motif containing protein [Kribbella sp. NPDC056861]|uniref:HNH endonuclease signature motif containing protein n=1 Tax=Kribbella sp. NPDC056861 TaxID=3154857 RepID=UPI0034370C96
MSRYIRRALNRRDKGCVICHAPPSNCHAHHLIHWIDGGPTSITNLVLLCGAHHRAVHAGHWTITITNGVVAVARPTWADPTPTNPHTLMSHVLEQHASTTIMVDPPPDARDPLRAANLVTAGSPAGGLSWLSPASVADLNPWGESGIPSAGP